MTTSGPKIEKIGTSPVTIAIVVVVVWSGAVGLGLSVNFNWFAAASLLLPVIALVLSLRLRLRIDGDELILRSYLHTFRIQRSAISYATHVPYAGLLNRGNGAESWLNLNQYMLSIGFKSGRNRDYPATMLSKNRMKRLAQEIHAWAGGDLPA